MISGAYDTLYAKYGRQVPVAYFRALAEKESGTNPRAAHNPSAPNAARGLLQIVGVAREEYNRKNGTRLVPDDLWDVETNVKVAASTLNTIVDAYRKHPSANLKTDWNNPEFVKLVTAGWNAGYSEGGGVGKVATYLERAGIPVTHDSVVANAGAAGAVSTVGDGSRRAWAQGVAALYAMQPDKGQLGGINPMVMLAIGVLGFAWWYTS